MAFYNNVIAGAAGAGGADADYKINQSLRFYKDESGHLFRNSAQGDQKTFTWSGWVKRGSVSSYQRLFEANENNSSSSHMLTFTWHSNNNLEVMGRTGGTNNIYVTTTTQFYDTTAWYHIVMAVDTTASANTDKVKIYVNNRLQDATYHVTTPDNYKTAVNKDKIPTYIGSQGGGGNYLDGYLADVHFVDGAALTPGAFAGYDATTGVWDPKEVEITTPNDNTAYISSSTLNSGNRGAGAGDSAMFDGVLPTGFSSGGNFGGTDVSPSTTSSSLTINLSKSLSGKVTIYPYFAASAANCSVVFSNGNTVNLSGSRLDFSSYDLGTQSSFNSITFNQSFITGGGSNFAIAGIAIDGVLLVDNSTSDRGVNGFNLNFDTLTAGGTDYTTGCSFSDNNPGKIGGPFINMFDGNFQTRVECAGISGDTYNSMTINLPSTLSGTFRAYMRSETSYGTPRIKLFNGNTEVYNQIVDTGNAPGWHSFGNVTFNKIFYEVTLTSGAGSGADFYVWEIDGVPLVNWDMTTDDESSNSNTFKGRNINISDNHYYDDYGTGVDQYIPDQYTRTSNVNSIFTDDDQGIMVNWDGKNFIALTATSSTISLKYINYDGSANNIPVATLHSDTAWNGAQGSVTSSGSAQNNDPITRNYSVTSGSKYYVRTGHTGPGGPMLLLYVTGATIAPISESNSDYDVMFDSPTNGTVDGNDIGNYATLNPQHELSDVVLLQGNLDVRWSAGNGHSASSTLAMSSGKWYFEVNTGANACVGIRITDLSATNWPGSDSGSYGYATDGRKVSNSSYSSFGDAHQRGDIIGVAFDADAGKLWFSRNGTWQASGDPANGSNPAFSSIPTSYSWYANVGYWTGNTSYVNSVNFGQRPWGYTPPAGFKALCTQNLAEPAIANGSTAFDTKLFTGNGGTNTITGLEFSPDLTWIKRRNSNGSHSIHDVVRGPTKRLRSESSDAETTETTALTAFTSDGFTLGSGGTANGNNDSFVSWNWDAGSSTVSNTDGTITSSVRANQTAGFSIVSYTGNSTGGATVGHGLNAKPELIILKARNSGQNWFVNFPVGTGDGYLMLNADNAGDGSNNTVWNSTDPTSSVFTLGTSSGVNGGNNYIAYCFAPREGFSAFGSYTGSGSGSTAQYNYCGFRPAFLMVKRTDQTGWWSMWDTKRNPYNKAMKNVWANDVYYEVDSGAYGVNFFSNGFKMSTSHADRNASNANYTWIAFASEALNYARAH